MSARNVETRDINRVRGTKNEGAKDRPEKEEEKEEDKDEACGIGTEDRVHKGRGKVKITISRGKSTVGWTSCTRFAFHFRKNDGVRGEECDNVRGPCQVHVSQARKSMSRERTRSDMVEYAANYNWAETGGKKRSKTRLSIRKGFFLYRWIFIASTFTTMVYLILRGILGRLDDFHCDLHMDLNCLSRCYTVGMFDKYDLKFFILIWIINLIFFIYFFFRKISYR